MLFALNLMYSIPVSVWHRVSTRYCSIAVFGDFFFFFFFAILRYLANFNAVLRCSEPPNVPLFRGWFACLSDVFQWARFRRSGWLYLYRYCPSTFSCPQTFLLFTIASCKTCEDWGVGRRKHGGTGGGGRWELQKEKRASCSYRVWKRFRVIRELTGI